MQKKKFFSLLFFFSLALAQQAKVDNIKVNPNVSNGEEDIITVTCSVEVSGVAEQEILFQCQLCYAGNNIAGPLPIKDGYQAVTATAPYNPSYWSEISFGLRRAWFLEKIGPQKRQLVALIEIFQNTNPPARLGGSYSAPFNWEVQQTTAPVQEDANTLLQKANQAYSNKQYAQGAQLFVAAINAGNTDKDNVYNASCCFALAGQKDKAFEYLQKAIDQGFTDVNHIQNDSDLNSLHNDNRWNQILSTLSLQSNHHTPPVRENNPTPNNPPTTQNKKMGEYFDEAYRRFEEHPNPEYKAAGFSMDSLLVGEWVTCEYNGEYGVFNSVIHLKSDGTGSYETLSIKLTKEMTLAVFEDETKGFQFLWGVYATLNDAQEPVTWIRLVNPQENTAEDFYYARFENGAMSFIGWDKDAQKPSADNRKLFESSEKFLKDWDQGKEKLRKIFIEVYQAKQQNIQVRQMIQLQQMQMMQTIGNQMYQDNLNCINNMR